MSLVHSNPVVCKLSAAGRRDRVESDVTGKNHFPTWEEQDLAAVRCTLLAKRMVLVKYRMEGKEDELMGSLQVPSGDIRKMLCDLHAP